MKRTLSLIVVLITATSLSAETRTRYLIATRLPAGATKLQMISDAATAEKHAVRKFTYVNAFAADLTEAEAAELRKSSAVRYIAPVVERSISDRTNAQLQPLSSRRYSEQQTIPYGIDAIGARQLWPYTRGGGGVINVVVGDTGIDLTHPDLQSHYMGGYSVFDGSTNPVDDHGHGTHVSGTIAAADNGFGVVGVAPDVRLWSVKVLRANGTGNDENIIAGVDWVIAKKRELGGNWILSLSLGASTASDAEKEAFVRAISEGILVVAAAGNRSQPKLDLPAAYDGVLAISAIDSANAMASFSSFGNGVGFAAPGVAVLSTVRVGTASGVDIEIGVGQVVEAIPLVGTSKGEVTGQTVFCGFGRPGEVPADLTGKIAVFRRSPPVETCEADPTKAECPPVRFKEKALSAKAAGAAGVIILPNDSRGANLLWTLLADEGDEPSMYPLVVSVAEKDVEKIMATIGKEPITAGFRLDDYESWNGTSMATPHVAASAALVWSLAPTATAEQVRLAMKLTAFDLGTPGYDERYGYGRIDPFAAAKFLAPAVLGVPNPPPPLPRKRPGH
jgi:serine protease